MDNKWFFPLELRQICQAEAHLIKRISEAGAVVAALDAAMQADWAIIALTDKLQAGDLTHCEHKRLEMRIRALGLMSHVSAEA